MPSQDKINIFVSSTIKECEQERQEARKSITSINHNPILFEQLGARPHPPRTMYQRGIEESAIFIGIYKDSYGYIAPDMTISGIEDEYRLASSRGMRRLIYLYVEAKQREARLEKLISEIKQFGGVTVATYSNPSDLYEMIRNDVTATVSETFLTSDLQDYSILPQPSSILESLVPNQAHRLRRLETEEKILALVGSHGRINISGHFGSGKTVLLLILAVEHGWIYLNGYARSAKEILSQAANALRMAAGQSALSITTIQAAERTFAEAWNAASSGILVIDGLDDIRSLEGALCKATPSPSTKCLIVATRTPVTNPSFARYEIPKLGQTEVAATVEAIRGKAPSEEELDEIVTRSDGNYLYLRYYVSGVPGTFEPNIKSYELREWEALSPQAKEALTYLALADAPLSLSMLHNLLGGKTSSVETTLDILSTGHHLLRIADSRYQLFHEHFQETICELVKSNNPRHRFYAQRLGRSLYKSGDPLSAFMVLDQAGDPKALKLIDEALFQAVYSGDILRGINLAERRLAQAREHANPQDAITSLLSLAELKQHSGDLTSALGSLAQAEAVAKSSPNPVGLLLVRERKLSMEAWSSGSKSSIEQLAALRDEYNASGDEHGAARVRLDMSAAYIRCGNAKMAEAEARSALESFKTLRDDYGTTQAKSNLLSALSALPEHTEEAESLLTELSEQFDTVETPRQRAFICNVYSRRHREQGSYDLAIKFSNEAIAIGRMLGDTHVVALNQVNLGNAHRDKGDIDEALSSYTEASKGAGAAKIIQLEASANEAIAQIHNLEGEPKKALEHSTYAIALARDTSDKHTLARAYQERAEANQALRKRHDAITDYLEGARALSDQPMYQGLKLDLVEEGLWLVAEEGTRNLFEEFLEVLAPTRISPSNSVSPQQILYRRLPGLFQVLPTNRVIDFAGLIFRIALSKMPPIYATRIMKKLFEKLKLSSKEAAGNRNLILTVATFLTSVPIQGLTIKSIVEIAEELSEQIDGLYVKPRQDGSLHITLRLDFDTPVICTVGQLDDRTDIALTTLVLALLLKGLEREIQTELLLVERVPRSEVSIQMVNVDELVRQIGPTLLTRAGLELPMREACSVTRASQPISEGQIPLITICRGDLADGWQPGYRKGGSLQVLLGLVLIEFVHFLFGGDVDLETIRPKIVSVVQKTMS